MLTSVFPSAVNHLLVSSRLVSGGSDEDAEPYDADSIDPDPTQSRHAAGPSHRTSPSPSASTSTSCNSVADLDSHSSTVRLVQVRPDAG